MDTIPDPSVTLLAPDSLATYTARIEALETDKADISADIKEVYGQVKAAGFDPKILRVVIRLRKLSEADREEMESLTDLYLRTLGDAA